MTPPLSSSAKQVVDPFPVPAEILDQPMEVGLVQSPYFHIFERNTLGCSEAESVIQSNILSVQWQPPAKHEILENTAAVYSTKIRFLKLN